MDLEQSDAISEIKSVSTYTIDPGTEGLIVERKTLPIQQHPGAKFYPDSTTTFVLRGAEYALDGWNSYFRFKLKLTNPGPKPRLNPIGAPALIERLTIESATGLQLFNYIGYPQYLRMLENGKCNTAERIGNKDSSPYWEDPLMMEGKRSSWEDGRESAYNRPIQWYDPMVAKLENSNTGITVELHLWETLLKMKRFLPLHLMGPLTIRITWAPYMKCIMQEGASPANATYEISNFEYIAELVKFSQSFTERIAQAIATRNDVGGLPLTITNYWRTENVVSAEANYTSIDINKSCANAQAIIAILQDNNSQQYSLKPYLNPLDSSPMGVCKYQFQIGADYYPQQPVEVIPEDRYNYDRFFREANKVFRNPNDQQSGLSMKRYGFQTTNRHPFETKTYVDPGWVYVDGSNDKIIIKLGALCVTNPSYKMVTANGTLRTNDTDSIRGGQFWMLDKPTGLSNYHMLRLAHHGIGDLIVIDVPHGWLRFQDIADMIYWTRMPNGMTCIKGRSSSTTNAADGSDVDFDNYDFSAAPLPYTGSTRPAPKKSSGNDAAATTDYANSNTCVARAPVDIRELMTVEQREGFLQRPAPLSVGKRLFNMVQFFVTQAGQIGLAAMRNPEAMVGDDVRNYYLLANMYPIFVISPYSALGAVPSAGITYNGSNTLASRNLAANYTIQQWANKAMTDVSSGGFGLNGVAYNCSRGRNFFKSLGFSSKAQSNSALGVAGVDGAVADPAIAAIQASTTPGAGAFDQSGIYLEVVDNVTAPDFRAYIEADAPSFNSYQDSGLGPRPGEKYSARATDSEFSRHLQAWVDDYTGYKAPFRANQALIRTYNDKANMIDCAGRTGPCLFYGSDLCDLSSDFVGWVERPSDFCIGLLLQDAPGVPMSGVPTNLDNVPRLNLWFDLQDAITGYSRIPVKNNTKPTYGTIDTAAADTIVIGSEGDIPNAECVRQRGAKYLLPAALRPATKKITTFMRHTSVVMVGVNKQLSIRE